MSDGTSWLRLLNPETLSETKRIQVLDKGEPVERLNELEWVHGEVWANIWQEPRIARVDPETGQVLGWIDFTSLKQQEPAGVLNGIAVKGRKVFVTGKNWSHIYRVTFVSAE
jgi:glutamine cyclotransferase